ncbi:MAG: AtpZ/AtpI family protein [Planctomycetota bacterium]|nr:MAG: AtpZ/AtpI family protein [Planctomycetota bacterium]
MPDPSRHGRRTAAVADGFRGRSARAFAMRSNGGSSGPNYLPQMMRLAAAGTELLAWVLVPTLIGYWIDRRYESSPVGVLVGGVFGVVGGLTVLIRRAMQVSSEVSRTQKRDDRDE